MASDNGLGTGTGKCPRAQDTCERAVDQPVRQALRMGIAEELLVKAIKHHSTKQVGRRHDDHAEDELSRARLLERCREHLVAVAAQHDLMLRQNYSATHRAWRASNGRDMFPVEVELNDRRAALGPRYVRTWGAPTGLTRQ